MPDPPPGSPGFFDVVDLDPVDLRTLFPSGSDESIPISQRMAEAEAQAAAAGPSGAGPSPPPPTTEPDRIGSGQPETNFVLETGETEPLSIAAGSKVARKVGREVDRNKEHPEVSSTRSRTSRDVVLPRVAVVSWALFVLLALLLAFVAGLLLGRFVWGHPV